MSGDGLFPVEAAWLAIGSLGGVWRRLMEKRNSTPTRCLLTGRIIFNNRTSVIDCTVRDISDTGARIIFAQLVLVPAEFDLDIPKRGPAVHVHLMWSKGNEHGVMFGDAPTLPR